MNKVKILHCADLHFDTPFKELNKEISQVSKEELLQVFKNIIDLTINENVEVLLIAGDVFDNLTVNKNTLFFILLGVWGLLTLPFPFVTIGIRLYMQLIYSSL